MLQQPDREAADHVDGEDQHRGDRVAADELRRTVHRTVEVRLLRDLLAAAARLLVVDRAGVELGVDRHLLAGHRIEREARRHLGDPAGTLGHDDEVDHRQDREHDDADREVAADQEVRERLDDLARGVRTGVPVHQHRTRRGHVERQPQHRRQQQHRRERREVERLDGVRGDQQHDQRDRDVEREEHVEQERRQRQHQHRQQHDDQHRCGERLRRRHRERHPGRTRVRAHASRSCGSRPGGSTMPGSAGLAPPPRACWSSWYTHAST